MSEMPELTEVAEEESTLTQYVNFVLEDETYAVPMNDVEEIIRLPQTFNVPMTPSYLIGLANLRGQVLPVLCLRTLLDMGQTEATEATRVVVMHLGAQVIGFTVDRVINVATPSAESIKETNTAGGKIDDKLICNTIHQDDHIIQVLSTDELFDSSITKDIDRCANHFTASKSSALNIDEDDEDINMRQMVCCVVDEQEYGFPLEDTQEIVRIPEVITKVPKAGGSILGMINLRGRTLPLISLRSLFYMPQIPFEESHRVLVVNLQGENGAIIPVGVVIDAVREVIRLHINQLSAVPSMMSQQGQKGDISAICNLDGGKRTLSVIDVQNLFDAQTFSQIKEANDQEATDMNALAENVEAFDEESTDTQLVIFKLDKEEFGISIHTVQEIIRIPEEISRVPKTDEFIEGVINLRGNVLPIVDLRRRFGLEDMERHERQRILVVNYEKVSTGFVVDSVSEVLRIPESQLEEAPMLSEEQSVLMQQVVNFDKRMIGVLAAEQLLSNTEMYKLYMAANEAG